MKHLTCITLISAFLQLTACADPAANKALYDQINAHWNNRAYSQILAIIDARKQADADDVLALATFVGLRVFVVNSQYSLRFTVW